MGFESLMVARANRTGAAPSFPSRVPDAAQARGKSLDPSLRTSFESRLGHDFSKVRIHDTPAAASIAASFDAAALTVGPDIAFGANRFSPGTPRGMRLLAHELTHCAQQDGGRAEGGSSLPAATSDDRAERDAAAGAARLSRGLPYSPVVNRPLEIACQARPTADLDPDPLAEINADFGPAQMFAKLTISVVADHLLEALARFDSVDFLNRLRALDYRDRLLLESDTRFQREIRRHLHGAALWTVVLRLHEGDRRASYERELLYAASDRDARRALDILRANPALRNGYTPGVAEMLAYEFRHDPRLAELLRVTAEPELKSVSVQSTISEVHYDDPEHPTLWQSISNTKVMRRFGSFVNFDIDRTASEMQVIVRIKFVDPAGRLADVPENKLREWRSSIDRAWNGRFHAANGVSRLNITFDPFFTIDSFAHKTVIVRPGDDRSDTADWYLGDTDPDLASHEFGHMLGDIDEYNLPSTTAEIPASFGLTHEQAVASTIQGVTGQHVSAGSPGHSLPGLMGFGGPPMPRHVAPALRWFNAFLRNPSEPPYHVE